MDAGREEGRGRVEIAVQAAARQRERVVGAVVGELLPGTEPDRGLDRDGGNEVAAKDLEVQLVPACS